VVVVVTADDARAAGATPANVPAKAIVTRATIRVVSDAVFFICRRLTLEIIPIFEWPKYHAILDLFANLIEIQ
jgi:hypothetical protein